MKLSINGSDILFEPVALKFKGNKGRDLFQSKNNKTLAQTLEHKRYAKLKEEIQNNYSKDIDRSLGTFLIELKNKGDEFYKRFLNKYGDLQYSEFCIADDKYLDKKEIYLYLIDDEIKYIGRCKDSLKKRVNQGYGKIHPKNCYLDGQATNCHLNALITDHYSDVTMYLFIMDDDTEIEQMEKRLLSKFSPSWNIQNG
jgi:hypothetical protein